MNDFLPENIKNDVKGELRSVWEKIPKLIRRILVWIFVIFTVISYFSLLFSIPITINYVRDYLTSKRSGSEPSPPQGDSCISGYFDDGEKRSLWGFDKYFGKPDKDGFYCPSRPKYPYWLVWYNEKLPINYKSSTIRYVLRDNTPTNNKPPPAIFSYGEKQLGGEIETQYSLIIPDGDLKSFRYSGFGQKRLNQEIDFNKEMEIKFQPTIIDEEGTINIFKKFDYISESGSKEATSSSQQIKLDIIKPESEGASKKFGFGVEKGDCIKPIWFKICP